MNPGSTPPGPAPGGKTSRKSHFGLIAGGVVVLSLPYAMGACGHRSAKPSDASAAAPVASADAGGTAAAAPAAAPSGAGANPILGQWTLVDTDKAASCQSSQTFTADTGTSVLAGKTSTGHLIYDVKPTSVYVSYGGPVTEQWDVNGPDDLTLEQVSPYSVNSCRYHRA